MTMIAYKYPDIQVVVVNISASHIKAWNSDHFPIFESALDNVSAPAMGVNLHFSFDVESHAVDSNIIFISVNTPTKTHGLGAGKTADLTYA
ncbi:UDP-glucose 6-dehydrogenase 2 [Acorus gramineus]|uniref:UDP-glucose 6-dehydrogenase 2 n=1 Tax=Acorus gramineus TaxID=55184 RepID=A0AAV9AAL6_ACOGR|nr:UDP-glucose 6-dehydrogenase 2 [Acorus gramineus]